VIDIFMAHLRIAQSNRGSPATLICDLRPQQASTCPPPLAPCSGRALRRSCYLSVRPATARRASGSDRSSSRATGMGCRGASAPGIVAPGAWVSACGCSFAFDANPPALDVADDGLTALVDVDVLHRDLLLAFAAVAIESIEQSRIGAESLLAWLKFSRRPSNVCSPIMARR